ncbi:MAG: NUDIX domain-containing protein [Clostridia bacterium]|nr:NUDIX domain-containing protein [Clostridia bacterium]
MATKKGGCFLINRETKQIALIFRPKKNDYSFPKGHIEEGENLKECAIRETIEETARDIKLIMEEPIYINKYTTPQGEDVEVYFYLAEDLGEYQGEIKEEDKEISEWFDIKDVRNILSYDDLIEMWDEVLPIIETQI